MTAGRHDGRGATGAPVPRRWRHAAVRDLATDPLISTKPDEKQDRVTELFDKYNLLALPVLEEDGSLAGVITADDVISVLRQK